MTVHIAQQRHGKPFRSHTRHLRVTKPSKLLVAINSGKTYDNLRHLMGREALTKRCDACGKEL